MRRIPCNAKWGNEMPRIGERKISYNEDCIPCLIGSRGYPRFKAFKCKIETPVEMVCTSLSDCLIKRRYTAVSEIESAVSKLRIEKRA